MSVLNRKSESLIHSMPVVGLNSLSAKKEKERVKDEGNGEVMREMNPVSPLPDTDE